MKLAPFPVFRLGSTTTAGSKACGGNPVKLLHESCVKSFVTFLMGIKMILVYFSCVLVPWRKCIWKSTFRVNELAQKSDDPLNSSIKKLLN